MRQVFAYKWLKTIWKTVKLSDQKRELLSHDFDWKNFNVLDSGRL